MRPTHGGTQLPRRDRLSLLAACESVPLERGSVLCETGTPTRHGDLPRRGLVHYQRGDIAVLNRAGLESGACTCYAADRMPTTGCSADPNPCGRGESAPCVA